MPSSETPAPVQAAAGGPFRRGRRQPAAAFTAGAAAAAGGATNSRSIQAATLSRTHDPLPALAIGILFWLKQRLGSGFIENFNDDHSKRPQVNIPSFFSKKINPQINQPDQFFCTFILTFPKNIQEAIIDKLRSPPFRMNYSRNNLLSRIDDLKKIIRDDEKNHCFSYIAPVLYNLLYFFLRGRGERSPETVESFASSACFLLKSVEREYRLALLQYAIECDKNGKIIDNMLLYKLYEAMGETEFRKIIAEFAPEDTIHVELKKMLLSFLKHDFFRKKHRTSAAGGYWQP